MSYIGQTSNSSSIVTQMRADYSMDLMHQGQIASFYKSLLSDFPMSARIPRMQFYRPGMPQNPKNAMILDTDFDVAYTATPGSMYYFYALNNNKSIADNPKSEQHYEVDENDYGAAAYIARSKFKIKNRKINVSKYAREMTQYMGMFQLTPSWGTSVGDDVLGNLVFKKYDQKIGMQNMMLYNMFQNSGFATSYLDNRNKGIGVTLPVEQVNGIRVDKMSYEDLLAVRDGYRDQMDNIIRETATGRSVEDVVDILVDTHIRRDMLVDITQVAYTSMLSILSNFFSQATLNNSVSLKDTTLSGYAVDVNSDPNRILIGLNNNITNFNYDNKYNTGATLKGKPLQQIVYANGSSDPTDVGTELQTMNYTQWARGYDLYYNQISSLPVKQSFARINTFCNVTMFKDFVNSIYAVYKNNMPSATAANPFQYYITGHPMLNFLLTLSYMAVNQQIGMSVIRNLTWEGRISNFYIIPDAYYNDMMTNSSLLPDRTTKTFKYKSLSDTLNAAIPTLGTDTGNKLGIARICLSANHKVSVGEQFEFTHKALGERQQYLHADYHTFTSFGNIKTMHDILGEVIIECAMGEGYSTYGAEAVARDLVRI